MPFGSSNVGVDTGTVVEVESGEVEFPDVTGIVHVSKEDVYVLRCAETCKVWLLIRNANMAMAR